jgi:hypothetical protein
MYGGTKMASLIVWLLLIIFGGIGGIVICSVFKEMKCLWLCSNVRNDSSFIKWDIYSIKFNAPR